MGIRERQRMPFVFIQTQSTFLFLLLLMFAQYGNMTKSIESVCLKNNWSTKHLINGLIKGEDNTHE